MEVFIIGILKKLENFLGLSNRGISIIVNAADNISNKSLYCRGRLLKACHIK